jgi:hypothetical protein
MSTPNNPLLVAEVTFFNKLTEIVPPDKVAVLTAMMEIYFSARDMPHLVAKEMQDWRKCDFQIADYLMAHADDELHRFQLKVLETVTATEYVRWLSENATNAELGQAAMFQALRSLTLLLLHPSHSYNLLQDIKQCVNKIQVQDETFWHQVFENKLRNAWFRLWLEFLMSE